MPLTPWPFWCGEGAETAAPAPPISQEGKGGLAANYSLLASHILGNPIWEMGMLDLEKKQVVSALSPPGLVWEGRGVAAQSHQPTSHFRDSSDKKARSFTLLLPLLSSQALVAKWKLQHWKPPAQLSHPNSQC